MVSTVPKWEGWVVDPNTIGDIGGTSYGFVSELVKKDGNPGFVMLHVKKRFGSLELADDLPPYFMPWRPITVQWQRCRDDGEPMFDRNLNPTLLDDLVNASYWVGRSEYSPPTDKPVEDLTNEDAGSW